VRLDLSVIAGRHTEFVWREMHWPDELPTDVAVAMLRQLGTDQFVRLIAFEVEAREGEVVHRIGVAPTAAGRVTQLVGALVSNSALTPAVRRVDMPDAWRIALTNRHRPLLLADPERITRAVLAAVTAVGKNEQIAVQWLLGPAQAPRPVAASEAAPGDSWWQPLVIGKTELDPERRRALEAKRGDHAFACLGRVAIKAASPGRTRALAIGVLAALRTAEAPGIGIRLVKEPSDKFTRVAAPWIWPASLNVLELVGLLGWPLGDQPLPGIPAPVSALFRAVGRI
jgi:hypothetical protein